jgi:hypothetical protein
MKKFLGMLVVLLLTGVLYAEVKIQGYTNSQYENIVSSCMTNITWDRRVHEIEIIRKSTHTLYIDFFNIRHSSVALYGASSEAYRIDRSTGMLAPVYTLDRSTTIAPNFGRDIFKVESDDFSVWVSTDENQNTPDIDINAWGW